MLIRPLKKLLVRFQKIGNNYKNRLLRTTKELLTNLLPIKRRKKPEISYYEVMPRWKRKRSKGALTGGFVIPTIMMVLLVFSLVVGSILLRTSQQTQQASGNRQTQLTSNSANPAVERGKTKIEFFFKRDYRFPSGVPNDARIEQFVLNRQSPPTGWPSPYLDAGVYADPYTLPGETRIDINGDGVVDNAWSYTADLDGDGVTEAIAYSLIIKNSDTSVTPAVDLASTDAQKASRLVARTGPLTIINSGNSVCNTIQQSAASVGAGWQPINTATVRKNFQVNAVVVNRRSDNRSVTGLEFQQDRQLDRGNKWGVWFRYDLEAYPGPTFRWNGAMHTDGNIMWGQTAGGNSINIFLISSPSSCLYSQDNSEITLAQNQNLSGQVTFQGQVINANPTPDNFLGTSNVTLFPGPGNTPSAPLTLSVSTDSVRDAVQNASPYDFSLDPVALFTQDISRSRSSTDSTNASFRDPNWAASYGNSNKLSVRMLDKNIPRPYVDDTYRADDRWGPKPVYNSVFSVSSAASFGQPIPSTTDALVNEDPPPGFNAGDNQVDEDSWAGLDGYWERRARAEGLRIIVGQRLELGNRNGWLGSYSTARPAFPLSTGESLYPVSDATVPNLARQRKSLRDNLSAVQTSLVYHWQNDTDFPIAFVASASHNSNPATLTNSITFNKLNDVTTTDFPNGVPNIDFFNGLGTNGWEFKFMDKVTAPTNPQEVTSSTVFQTFVDNVVTDPWRVALNNLSLFAGDFNGAFPPVQETSGTTVHPYPLMSMWGDFSNLRRALRSMTTVGSTQNFNVLSIADRATVQSAAATIGMLAYTIRNAQQVYNAALADTATLASGGAGIRAIGEELWKFIDGDTTNGEIATPPTSNYSRNTSTTTSGVTTYNPTSPSAGASAPNTGYIPLSFPNRSATISSTNQQNAANFYAQFTPDQYIQAIQNDATLTNAAQKNLMLQRVRMIALLLQIERDRLYGFKTDLMPPVQVATTPPGGGTGVIYIKGRTNTTASSFPDIVPVPPAVGNTLKVDTNFSGTSRVVQKWSSWLPSDTKRGQITAGNGSQVATFITACDPLLFANAFPNWPANTTGGVPVDTALNPAVALSVALCTDKPKYPSLYYLFPKYAHLTTRVARNGETGFIFSTTFTNSDTRPWLLSPTSNVYIPTNSDFSVTNNTSYGTTEIFSLATATSTSTGNWSNTGMYDQPITNDSTVATRPIVAEEFLNPSPPVTNIPGVNPLANNYVFDDNSSTLTDINNNQIYYPPIRSDGVENGTENSIAQLAIEPRPRSQWKLPTSTTDTGSDSVIYDNTGATNTPVYLSFQDKNFYDARQMMQVRTLDLDLNLLRANRVPIVGNNTSDFWLPNNGVTYAFREDALREDGILRPSPQPYGSCNEDTEIATANCRMNTSPTAPQDPPVNSNTGISTKPVDYYPDPERKPYGFRLKNGARINRGDTAALDNPLRSGMSFISDNPIYIQGDLNLHQNSGGTRLEEFTQLLANDWSNFNSRTTLSTSFANADFDRWRAVEILGDALTVLSGSFCDGTAQDGFQNATNTNTTTPKPPGTCAGGQTSSYLNSTLNSATVAGTWEWQRENTLTNAAGAGSDTTSPILVDRNAVVDGRNAATLPLPNFAPITTYRALNTGRTRNNATDTRMNAIFINALVPSRRFQSYGGFHNFPRFIEDWNGNNLFISGAFVQLNFSTYGTAPWDLEAWEPGQSPAAGENLPFYAAPNRLWGYDVALQYIPPGPIAKRFISVGTPRNEFYKQTPADDPYIKQLRCASVSGQRIDTNATDCP
ncbi:MAG: hypothetical protein N5P05_003565 [Chroococcopsis gigantea SAG 12.99]|jgi:hypothetical protein|nr:hypothetical protein [Chroococcopsis gigantea SAG 12.99]